MAAITKAITLGDGQQAEIRKLSWKQVKKAARVQLTDSADQMKEFGAEFVKAFAKSDAQDVAEKVKAVEDARKTNPSSYDIGVCLEEGLVTLNGTSPTEAVIDEMDAGLADELHQAIVAFAFERAGKNA